MDAGFDDMLFEAQEQPRPVASAAAVPERAQEAVNGADFVQGGLCFFAAVHMCVCLSMLCVESLICSDPHLPNTRKHSCKQLIVTVFALLRRSSTPSSSRAAATHPTTIRCRHDRHPSGHGGGGRAQSTRRQAGGVGECEREKGCRLPVFCVHASPVRRNRIEGVFHLHELTHTHQSQARGLAAGIDERTLADQLGPKPAGLELPQPVPAVEGGDVMQPQQAYDEEEELDDAALLEQVEEAEAAEANIACD